MWASVSAVLDKKGSYTADDVAVADRVCEACALWDGSVEALAQMRFGWDWQITMSVISQGEQCWADVMRVCDAIVQNEGFFMASSGHIYTPAMIVRYDGRIREGVLTFPDDQGMYRGEMFGSQGDPWDGVYDRRSAWSVVK